MHPDDRLLNEYVDDTLDRDERTAIELHLESCFSCRALVDDVVSLTASAAALGTIEPPERVWEALKVRLKPDTTTSRMPTTALAWLAAAAAIVLAVWVGARYQPADTVPSPALTSAMVEAELREAEQHYSNAIGTLQQIASSQSGALDEATVATLQKNLALIDQAILESRTALASQPASDPAQLALLDNLRAKIALLNDTVVLITEARNGKG